MALQRKYDGVDISVRDQRQVKGGQVAGPGVSIGGRSAGDEGWADRMLIQLGNKASQTLETMGDIELQNQYLEGQASVGVVESEEELQGNPLTRDWKVAGYRDTMGKLKLADQEATFIADLPRLREMPPDELEQYMSERRDKIMPDLASMSREARAASMGQLLMQDRAAVKRHAVEHTKYITEQRIQAINSRATPSFALLRDAQDSAYIGGTTPEAHLEAVRSSAAMIVAASMDPGLANTAMRQEVVAGLVERALAQDSVNLYDYLAENKIPGKDQTLLQSLTGEQQLKLSNARRESETRTSDRRGFMRGMELENVQAQIKSGTFKGTGPELQQHLRGLVGNREISAARAADVWGMFVGEAYKGEQNTALGTALERGDLQAIRSMDKTPEDAVKAYQSTMNKMGLPQDAQMAKWLSVGSRGFAEGYKQAGEIFQVSLGALRTEGEQLPQHVKNFRLLNDAVRGATEAGQPHARMLTLSGLKEDDRMFAERIMGYVDQKMTYEEAIAKAKTAEVEDAGMTPSAKAARNTATATAVQKAITDVDSRGLFTTAKLWVQSLWSEEAAADLANRPTSFMGDRDGWFSDTENVQFYEESYKQELRRRTDTKMFLNPTADANNIISVSKADIAADTIKTAQGPVFLPKGMDVQATFGIPKGQQSKIGDALSSMFKPTKDGARWRMSFSEGKLLAYQYDRQGVPIGGDVVDYGSIKEEIARQTTDEQRKADQRHGAGRKVEADGLELRYNGLNTAGVPADWAFGLRSNLVEGEGVRKTPYKDLSGKEVDGKPIMTVGVGVSSHNKWYPQPDADGNISSDALRTSFNGASNDAAVAGAQYARYHKLYTRNGFMLMSELAYQSGTAFLTQKNSTGDQYRTFLTALQGKDVEAAKAEFKKTAAYRWSGQGDKETKRQLNYLSMIEETMKGR